jgi:uncharacterized protein
MQTVKRVFKWIGILLLLTILGLALWIGPMAYRALYPSHVHETVLPKLPESFANPAILVFSKTNGFRHDEAIVAANAMFRQLAKKNGWSVYETENGAVHSPELLSRFKAVVWSNASGDNLSTDQRAALKAYIENGGGFIGIHAAGDSSHEGWGWYVKDIIGTRFVGHSLWPHLAQATIHVEGSDHPAMAGLPAIWVRTDEWYSFDRSVRAKGVPVLATLDEASYVRGGPGSDKLSMGKDHPIIWSHCQGKGRALYSALGHTGEAFAEPEMRKLITNAVGWAMSDTQCDATTQR